MTEKQVNGQKWLDAKAITQKLNSELEKLDNKKGVGTPKFGGSSKGCPLLDPVLSMRIVHPVVSSQALKEKMVGRTSVSTLRIKNFIQVQNLKDIDWVTGGAVVSKFCKTSQNGNKYCVFSLTDLHGDIKLITVFLFGSAYQEFWKTQLGTVIGILNPGVMDSKNNKVEATLRVDNAQKVMVFGVSKDYGICKSKKKNGEMCTSIVNLSCCDYCVYHVKQAYSSASRRTELQSACAGRGLNNLRNKVLGKNEVFYAGNSFVAIPSKKNVKQLKKDEERLKRLSEGPSKLSQLASAKDNEILNRLNGKTTNGGDEKSRLNELTGNQGAAKDKDFLNKLSGRMLKIAQAPLTKNQDSSKQLNGNVVPSSLLVASTSGTPPSTPKQIMIDLDAPISKKQKNLAKINALKFVRQNGPLKKEMETKKKSPQQILSLKRRLESENEDNENKKAKEDIDKTKTGKDLLKEKQKRSGITDEFVKLMNSKTENVTLLKQAEEEEREKYFEKLEIREKMEEKMATTFKLECKAVRCLKCNYKSFSASDLCKAEKHPLKVVNAVKRFWKCGDCSARTVCLELVPLHSCKVCGSSKWERTSMMPEKKGPNLAREPLSIRGHEESFVGAVIQNPNLSLLVPDEGT